jgi:hypothetical protein
MRPSGFSIARHTPLRVIADAAYFCNVEQRDGFKEALLGSLRKNET